MLHFAFAKLVQMRAPLPILFQIFGDTLGEEDVAGIAAIHHALRDVDSRAGYVGPIIDIFDLIDRAAVNAHAQPKTRMVF
jgi:hypothetical protein